MKAKQTNQLYALISIIALAILCISIYATLGGFDAIEVFESESTERTIVGKEYIGIIGDSNPLDSIIELTKKDIVKGKLKGVLTIVDYNYNRSIQDSLHVFVGSSFDKIQGIVSMPAGYEYREFFTTKVYKVFVTQHWLLQPSIKKIYQKLLEQAILDGIGLQHAYHG